MFYAQKLLETYPSITEAVADRFDELIVDEAQDTSDVQMRCLELLHGTGRLKSLVLVGDVDQSIYSFQGARPERLVQLAQECGLAELRLTENFRSSQAICDVTCRFCGRDTPDAAVGPNRDADLSPEILFYDPSEPRTAVELFARRLDELAVAQSRAVILVRAHRFRDEVNGRPDSSEVSPIVASLGRLVASLRDRRTIERDEVRSVERALADMAWGTPSEPDPDTAHAVRDAVMTLLQTLPAMDGTLADWIEGAREAVKDVLPRLSDEPVRKPSNLIRKRAGDETIRASDVFSMESPTQWARTVHDAKGESHEAVLLVVEPPRRGWRAQAELWASPLIGEPVEADEAEELRIAYVALTRAERYCAVAMPADIDGEDLKPYANVGFAVNRYERPCKRPLQRR
jgi:superfamily I DNA/RNA helicase